MRHVIRLTLATALLLGLPLAGAAQDRPSSQPAPEQVPAPRSPAAENTQQTLPAVQGSADFGFRGTSFTGDKARYERYRDLRSGSWSQLNFESTTATHLFDAHAHNIGYRDQMFSADFMGARGWVNGSFVSTPLNFGYNTMTPWIESSPGRLTLDPAARQLVQSAAVVGLPQNATQLNTPSIYRGLAAPFTLQQLRQTGGVDGAYAFTKDTTFTGGFTSTARSGHQPWGASFAFNVANEVPLAIDSRTNDANAALEWTKTRGMFRVGWNGSIYNNHLSELVWDNPYRATSAFPYDASGYSNGNGSSVGRMSLPGDNLYNSVNAMGMFKLQRATVLNGSVSFTRMSQNDPLIPWTINPVLMTPDIYAAFPGLATLPRSTAQAKVDGINAVLNFSTRPNRFWGVTGRYRYNDHNNRTPVFNAEEYVRFDAVPEETGGESHPFDIVENLADVNVHFNVLPYTTLRVGYGYDAFDRTGRAFATMADNTARVSVDTVGNQWVTVRALYEFTRRQGSGFSEEAITEGGAQPGLRFYDEADRDRNRGTLLFVVNPMQVFDVTFSLATGKDDYTGTDHDFGLLDNTNRAYNAGINVYPSDAVNLGVNYGREHFAALQKSRNANPPPDLQFTDPNRDWFVNNVENVNNVNVFADFPKITSKANARVTYDFSDSDNAFNFSGPRILSLAAAGTFLPLPNVTNSWHRVGTDVQYFFVPKVGVGVDYWFEKMNVRDFNTINIPGTDTPRIDYLGEISTGYGNRPYTGHTAFVRLLYLF